MFALKLKIYANHLDKFSFMSTEKFKLTDEQSEILKDCNNQLIIGGPGSGKTTIAILKASQWVDKLKTNQNVLFLSFARATVSRVIEAIDEQTLIDKEKKKKIKVDTYHAFFWQIIKTHGYLLDLPRKLTILTPSNEAIALSNIRNNYGKTKDLSDKLKEEKRESEKKEIRKIAYEKGEIAFDLFAEITCLILKDCRKLLNLYALSYPVIILDEFQDTNYEQWEVIKCIGKKCTVIALADSEQRIFDFIGADPRRIGQYKAYFSPKEFNLRNENHRSSGTEIVKFGNDILKGSFQREYNGISLFKFNPNPNQAFAQLKIKTIKARKRLIENEVNDWTLAILVPTKKLMRQVSDNFNQKSLKLPSIHHHAVIDMHGAVLAAEIISFLLQPISNSNDLDFFIQLVCNFFYGKGGDAPAKGNIKEAISIQKSYDKLKDKIKLNQDIPKTSIMNAILDGYYICRKLKFTGNPYNDWFSVRDSFEFSNCKRLKNIALEAKNLRLLNRGTSLREALSQNWRNNGFYSDALNIVKRSFIVEHFSTSQKPETGVLVMNMHKAKGKQFDEVIIFEGWPKRVRGKIVGNPNRIVIGNMEDNNLKKYQYIFRVGVTRAKLHTTIMTPVDDPCILIKSILSKD